MSTKGEAAECLLFPREKPTPIVDWRASTEAQPGTDRCSTVTAVVVFNETCPCLMLLCLFFITATCCILKASAGVTLERGRRAGGAPGERIAINSIQKKQKLLQCSCNAKKDEKNVTRLRVMTKIQENLTSHTA